MRPLETMDRIRAAVKAGRALAPEDGAALLHGIEGDFRSIDAGLGLPPNWRAVRRKREMQAALEVIVDALGISAPRTLDSKIREMLSRYHSGSYMLDLRDGVEPPGLRGAMYRWLNLNGGELPGEGTIRNKFRRVG